MNRLPSPRRPARLLSFLVSVVVAPSFASAQDSTLIPASARHKLGPVLRELADRTETSADGPSRFTHVEVLLGREQGKTLSAAAREAVERDGLGAEAQFILRSEAAALQDQVLAGLGAGDYEVVHRLSVVPALVMNVDGETLRELALREDVQRLSSPPLPTLEMTEANALTFVDLAHIVGTNGAGKVIAVIDDGFDTDHNSFSGGKFIGGYDLADNDAVYHHDCNSQSHGTSVASIAAGDGTPITGVAPMAELVGVKIQRADNCGDRTLDVPSAYALDWVAANGPALGVNVVNLSLGGGSYASVAACEDSNGLSTLLVDLLTRAGVVVVAAAGNSGTSGAMGAPACIDKVLSVGATYDETLLTNVTYDVCNDLFPLVDQIACYSEAASFLDVLAPASVLTAAAASSTNNALLTDFNGTSAASPYVAGFVAAFLDVLEDLPQDQEDFLSEPSRIQDLVPLSSSIEITDTRNGLDYRRVDARDMGLLPQNSERIFVSMKIVGSGAAGAQVNVAAAPLDGTTDRSDIRCRDDGALCVDSLRPYPNALFSLVPVATAPSTFIGFEEDPEVPDMCPATIGINTWEDNIYCLARFEAPQTLTITRSGTGTGRVVADLGAIDCGTTCQDDYLPGTEIQLTPTPDAGSTSAGWAGDCNGVGGPLLLTMPGDATTCEAIFNLFPQVTVVKRGSGSGTVTGSGIDCGNTCSLTVEPQTAMSLEAVAAAGSAFEGWSGTCSGQGSMISFTVGVSDATCTATFGLDQATLTVARAGNGSGSVTSSPIGIDCGADCSQTYASGTVVTLTPAPATDSTFVEWTGPADCSDGQVTVDADITCTASFGLQQFTVTAAKDGSGAGTVTSSLPGIDCGADCSEDYDHGTVVTLTPTPAAGSSFAGWTGPPSCGSPITVEADITCTATFETLTTLTVSRVGSGAGSVTSSPGSIDCLDECSEEFEQGQQVTLTATATGQSSFQGWSGDCTGESPQATVTIGATDLTCTASFDPPRGLFVVKAGSGTGTVTGSPGAIDCGDTCSDTYGDGEVVTLTATPGPSSYFAAWSGGACSGTDPVFDVTVVDDDVTCTATFSLVQYTLTVVRDGNGSGYVTSQPIGIDCLADCSEDYELGRVVTLTAVPDIGSTFVEWSGPDDCTDGEITVTGDITCTATFDLLQSTLTVTRAGDGSGTITSSPAGIDCGVDCSEIVDSGTQLTLTPTAGPDSVFVGWAGALDCADGSVSMVGDVDCEAFFWLQTSVLFFDGFESGATSSWSAQTP